MCRVDCGIVHVQMFEDRPETRELIRLDQIYDDIRNLTVTDAIIIRHDEGE